MPDYYFYLILFISGLGIGSFLNVLILRYQPGKPLFQVKNLGGRSKCSYCHKTLSWFELIPIVSFLIQRGRCRRCRHKLTWQYPIVELLSGLIFVGIPLYLSKFYQLALLGSQFSALTAPRWFYGLVLLWIVVFLIWLIMTIIDIRHFVVPNELNLALVIIGLIIIAVMFTNQSSLSLMHSSFLRNYALIFSPFENIALNHLFGAGVTGLFFGLMVVLSRGRAMGLGDAKLIFASGLVLGWPDIGLAVILAFMIGGIVGLLLILIKKKKMHQKIPFAPFLILGMVLTFFFGHQIINSYFSLFAI